MDMGKPHILTWAADISYLQSKEKAPFKIKIKYQQFMWKEDRLTAPTFNPS